MYLRRIARAVGWDLDAIAGFPIAQLTAEVRRVMDALEPVAQVLDSPPQSLPEVLIALEDAGELFTALRAMGSIPGWTGKPAYFLDFGKDLVTALVYGYLHQAHPVLCEGLVLFALLDESQEAQPKPIVVDGNAVVRLRVWFSS